jgi:hypothetical protein
MRSDKRPFVSFSNSEIFADAFTVIRVPAECCFSRLQTVATTQTQLHQMMRKRMNAEMVRSRVTVPAHALALAPNPPPPPSTLSVTS